MKDLTTSIYTFEDLIQGNFLYVDKTEYIWQLVKHVGESYFLSRPRRFGKSLTVSTLKAVFEGKKELFKGLAIYDKPYDWKPCPIIHLDMNGRDFSTLESMEERFRQILRKQAEINGVTLKETSSDTMFHELIKTLHDQKGDVVILLDEYDKPILNNISKGNCSAFLDALKIFYSVIKEKNGMIRLAFITGVSKFCHASLSSELNNLTDITMDARFATMLGYTQEELEANFSDRLTILAGDHDELMQEIKRWYNGYRFEENATTVYNPVSLAIFFESGGKFNNYWFSTGTPTFLLDLIMKSKFELSLSLNKPVSGAFFDAFEVTDLDPMVMLFQTGYLTIDRAERRQIPFTSKAITEYYLHFPNMEVEESFNGSLLTYCSAQLLVRWLVPAHKLKPCSPPGLWTLRAPWSPSVEFSVKLLPENTVPVFVIIEVRFSRVKPRHSAPETGVPGSASSPFTAVGAKQNRRDTWWKSYSVQ